MRKTTANGFVIIGNRYSNEDLYKNEFTGAGNRILPISQSSRTKSGNQQSLHIELQDTYNCNPERRPQLKFSFEALMRTEANNSPKFEREE